MSFILYGNRYKAFEFVYKLFDFIPIPDRGLVEGVEIVLFSSVPEPVFFGGEPCLPRCRTVSFPVPDFCIPYYLLLVIQPNKSKKRKNLFANSKKSRTFASRLLSQNDKRLIHSKLVVLCPGKTNKW